MKIMGTNSRVLLGVGVIAMLSLTALVSFPTLWSLLSQTNASSWISFQGFQEAGSDQTAAICVVMKEEEKYIDEFVDYHSALGFSQIYVYDNSDGYDLRQWGYEKSRLAGHNVSVTHYPRQSPQSPSYLHCAQRAMREGHTWVAFIDGDEFLILKRHSNVVSFLKRYCKKGAISIHWIVMGTCGREVYSPQPLTKRFQYRTSKYPNEHIKTIVRLEHMNMTKEPHAHYPYLKEGYKRVTTSGKPSLDHRAAGGKDDLDVALIYHYTYKSYKEYLFKRQYRGRATVNSTDPSHAALINVAKSRKLPIGDVFDDTAWKAMKRIVPKYGYYDELFPDPPPPPNPQTLSPPTVRHVNRTCAINFHGLARSFIGLALPTITRNVILPNLRYNCGKIGSNC